MIKSLKYYEGIEFKYKFKWIVWNPIIRFIYVIFWMIKKPTIVNLKYPLHTRVQIIDEYGNQLMTIQEYNNKTKDAIMFPFIEKDGKINLKYGKDTLPVKINLPNSKMRLLLC